MPARPNGMALNSSRQRSASPNCFCARSRFSISSRAVAVAPGLMPTTRMPSAVEDFPSARVKAIKEALPAEPAM